jgi:P27 family predicted phage terminase small subunit
MGVLASTDRAVLSGYCEAWGEFSTLTAMVKRLGYAKAIGGGLLKAKNAASLRYLRFAGELGLSPASRSKVAIDPTFQESMAAKGRFFLPRGA